MENKYFTPSIEDIRVGYECELSSISQPGWGKWTINKLQWESFEGATIEDYLEIGNIRVPYLTKEQIEAEGWEPKELSIEYKLKPGVFYFHKGNYMMIFDSRNYSISIVAKDVTLIDFLPEFPETFRVTLPCKDINTFRYISKLLGIGSI